MKVFALLCGVETLDEQHVNKTSSGTERKEEHTPFIFHRFRRASAFRSDVEGKGPTQLVRSLFDFLLRPLANIIDLVGRNRVSQRGVRVDAELDARHGQSIQLVDKGVDRKIYVFAESELHLQSTDTVGKRTFAQRSMRLEVYADPIGEPL